MRREDHPLTPTIMAATFSLQDKVSVYANKGWMDRKPRWIAKWEGWFVRVDCGWRRVTGAEVSSTGRVRWLKI